MLQASSWAIARTDDKAWVSKKEDKELPCWHRKFKKKKKTRHYNLSLEGKTQLHRKFKGKKPQTLQPCSGRQSIVTSSQITRISSKPPPPISLACLSHFSLMLAQILSWICFNKSEVGAIWEELQRVIVLGPTPPWNGVGRGSPSAGRGSQLA